jgi:AFG3 family protein
VEMDGFGSQSNVVVFAATNLKDSLDPALLRPGRFDRIIDVPLPDIDARKKIFLIHLKKITTDKSKKIEEYASRLATLTPGFSGAQIENVCNEAAIIAARKDAIHVDSNDFEKAIERVIAGLEKSGRPDQDQRKLVAVHESGHGVVSWFLKNGPPLLKLTVVPRSKGSKGFSQYLANENFLSTKQDLVDSICIALAGTLSEELVLGTRTSSAADDLKKVEKLAHQLVTTFGMSGLGPVHRHESEYGFKSYSEFTNDMIDNEKMKIVKECELTTRKLLAEKLDIVKQLSDSLLLRETLTYEEIKAILGERPFPPKGSYKQYLDELTKELQNPIADTNQPIATTLS